MSGLTEFVKGQIKIYCYLVKNGKPAASVPVEARYLDGAESIVRSYGLRMLLEKRSGEWTTLWIYKHPYIAEIIRSLPRIPTTVHDHWVLGKLYGYSDEAIGEFIERSGYWPQQPIFRLTGNTPKIDQAAISGTGGPPD